VSNVREAIIPGTAFNTRTSLSSRTINEFFRRLRRASENTKPASALQEFAPATGTYSAGSRPALSAQHTGARAPRIDKERQGFHEANPNHRALPVLAVDTQSSWSRTNMQLMATWTPPLELISQPVSHHQRHVHKSYIERD
jgi:hypothetical protein